MVYEAKRGIKSSGRKTISRLPFNRHFAQKYRISIPLGLSKSRVKPIMK